MPKGGSYLAPNGIVRIANHILGGVRFGSHRNDSVLDVHCKAWDFDNLYVTDGSFGSAQESEDAPFLRCLAENEEFGLERRQPLRLQ
jgi:hypothetical protein